MADTFSALPLAEVIGQLPSQFTLELCLTRISAFRRFEIVLVDVKRLKVDAVDRQLLSDVRVMVFLLGVVVYDLLEAVVDLPVTVIEKLISLVHLGNLRNDVVRLKVVGDPLVVRVE